MLCLVAQLYPTLWDPRDSPALQVDFLPPEPPGKPKNTDVGSLSLLQGIFPTQESKQGLLHCRRTLYQLSYQGSPNSGMPTNKCKSNGEITGNGTLLQCSCLENPRDGGAWLAAVYGVSQSQTRLKWLSSSSNDRIRKLSFVKQYNWLSKNHHCMLN